MSPAPAPPGPQQLASTLALAVASTLLTLYTVARLASVRTSPHWVWAALAAGLGTTGVCVDVALVAVCGAARVPERVLLLLGAGTATLLTFAFACVAGGPRAWALYAVWGAATVLATYRVVARWPVEEGEEGEEGEESYPAEKGGAEACL